MNGSKYCGSVLKNDFVVIVVGVLTNFFHIFKESDYFESLVKTCPKQKIVVGAAYKYITKKLKYFSKCTKHRLNFRILVKIELICPNLDSF